MTAAASQIARPRRRRSARSLSPSVSSSCHGSHPSYSMIAGQERSSGSRSLRSRHMWDFQLVPMMRAASTLRWPSWRLRCIRRSPRVSGSGVSSKGLGARNDAVTLTIKKATRQCRAPTASSCTLHCARGPRHPKLDGSKIRQAWLACRRAPALVRFPALFTDRREPTPVEP